MLCPLCGVRYPAEQTACPHDGATLVLEGVPTERDDESSLVDTYIPPRPRVTSQDDPLCGTTLDARYDIIERIGSGGMGTVYRAHQRSVERDVAIKVLRVEDSAGNDSRKRFENEAKIIARLRHPNTVKLFDFGQTSDGRLYFVIELLEGQPLSGILKAGPIGSGRTLAFVKQICQSLTEAHAFGIVHRDLKPPNAFVENVAGQEVVKVLDFGIAKLAEAGVLTMPGRIFGTPAYMSPEQAVGERTDARSDLYSLGIVAYECLVGRVPFNGDGPGTVLLKQMKEAPVPPRVAAPRANIPPALDALIMKLLEKEAARRHASAAALLEHIDALTFELARATDLDASYALVTTQPSPYRSASGVLPTEPGQLVPPTVKTRPLSTAPAVAPIVQETRLRTTRTDLPATDTAHDPRAGLPRGRLGLAIGIPALALAVAVVLLARISSGPAGEPPIVVEPIPMAGTEAPAAPDGLPAVSADPVIHTATVAPPPSSSPPETPELKPALMKKRRGNGRPTLLHVPIR